MFSFFKDVYQMTARWIQASCKSQSGINRNQNHSRKSISYIIVHQFILGKGSQRKKKKETFMLMKKKKKRNKKETRAVYIMLTIILWSCKSCWCLRWNSCPHRCCWSSRFSYSDRRRNVWQQGIHYLENQKLKKTSDFWRVIHKINGHMISFKLWHSPQNLLNSSQLGLGKFCVFFIANRTYSWSLVRKFFAIWRLSLTDSVS